MSLQKVAGGVDAVVVHVPVAIVRRLIRVRLDLRGVYPVHGLVGCQHGPAEIVVVAGRLPAEIETDVMPVTVLGQRKVVFNVGGGQPQRKPQGKDQPRTEEDTK